MQVPSPALSVVTCNSTAVEDAVVYNTPIVNCEKFSSFYKLLRVYSLILTYFDNLKRAAIQRKSPDVIKCSLPDFENEAFTCAMLDVQKAHYSEVYNYLAWPHRKGKDLPNIVGQLNVFSDSDGVLRVKCKFKRWIHGGGKFLIRLPPKSPVTGLIIKHFHGKLKHADMYGVLSELRKVFWIPHVFSAVKKAVRDCVLCRRLNNRSVKLNHSSYRDFRIDPPKIPFRYVFIDYMQVRCL